LAGTLGVVLLKSLGFERLFLMPRPPSNRAMERTADRCALHF
jgi:hypothetical protein